MMIKRLTRREQGIFAVCMITIGVYAGYAGLLKPLRARIVSADREIGTYQRRLAKNAAAIRTSEALEARYKEYFSRFKQSKTDEQVMASMLAEIEGVAGGYGLRISELKPNKVRKNAYYNKFSVSLTIDGGLADILRFLHSLQGEEHFFDVEDARFDKGSRRESDVLKTRLGLSKIFIP